MATGRRTTLPKHSRTRATSELRDSIVRPIENALSGTQDLDHIDSTIQSGSAQITASFALNSSPSVNLTNVQKALQQTQGQLPTDLIAPTIDTADPSQPVIVTIALTSRRLSADALGNLAENQIVPVLEQVPGVSTVNVKGQTQQRLRSPWIRRCSLRRT